MGKIEEIKLFLEKVGMPKEQLADICCRTLLAMAGLTERISWSAATNNWMRIHDIIAFCNANFGTSYAENSRETFRKQAMHHFRSAALIEDNGKATNSPNYMYRLTAETLKIIQSIHSFEWETRMRHFKNNHPQLIDMYASKRQMSLIPIKINNQDFRFSTGAHNELQKAIIEDFAPRFAPGADCLYIGDTTDKALIKDVAKLEELGFEITLHDKMPDVILHSREKNWLYFVEAVTSVGPMNPKRIMEIKAMTQNVKSGKIFVTAFPDFGTYKKFIDVLAWDTEVWLAETPEHLIHLNGDRFLGPRD